MQLIETSGAWLWWLGGVGTLLFACTLVLAPWLIARLPTDHFITDRQPDARHPAQRLALLVVRNTLAAIALVLGLIMLVTPGPGVVMLVLALSISHFPGRHRLIQRLATQPTVFDTLNWLRRRRNRPPFARPLALIAPAVLLGMLWLPPAPQAIAQDEPTSGTPVPQAPDPDSVEAQLADTELRLQQLDAALVKSRQEREALAARWQGAQASAAERGERIAGLDADIARYSATLTELEERVERERQGIAERQARIGASLRRLQRLQGPGPLAVLLRHDDPAQAERVSVWAGYALRAQRDSIARQNEALERIRTAHARALKDRNWLEHLKSKAGGQRDAQLAASQASAAAVATIDSRITETARSVASLRADADRLQTLLEQLRAAEAARSGYFEAGKGDWPAPVAGRLDARFGDVKSVGRLAWNGLFIRAEAGGEVVAVADGEVVYADWLTGFGLLVIVDHGDGWMTLYGGNRELLAPVGAWVESGATIATVGDSSGQSATGLYFEIRHDARPVDPEPWLSGIG